MTDLITHVKDGVMILDFGTTSILDQDQVDSVGSELSEVAGSPELTRILLDLNRIDFMSSAMIGEFLSFNTKCQEKGTKVRVCNLSSDMQELFRMTSLNSVFDIHKTREEAMAAFAKA